jgi:hypothetical protein
MSGFTARVLEGAQFERTNMPPKEEEILGIFKMNHILPNKKIN